MIHVVSLAHDVDGRSRVDSRVLDADPGDGLNQTDRVSSAIDVMCLAVGDDFDTSPVCVAVRPGDHTDLRRRGSGRTRSVRVVDEDLATARYLREAGLLGDDGPTLVIDGGDSGMTLFSAAPDGSIADVVRSESLSGAELDRRIAVAVAIEHGWFRRPGAAQITACRTAKEELFTPAARPHPSLVQVTLDDVAHAIAPLIDAARGDVAQYIKTRMRGRTPPSMVVVGGLAHVPFVVAGLGAAAGVDAIVAPSPDLAGALGAALIERDAGSAGRHVVIGGRRSRDKLFAAPLVLAGVSVGVIALSMSSAGVSSSGESPYFPMLPKSPSLSAVSDLTTRTTVPGDIDVPLERTRTPGAPEDGGGPGWATTRLNPTTPARTRTLVPTTLPPTSAPQIPSTSTSSSRSRPTLPLPSGLNLPPNLIPSELIPAPSRVPRQHAAPSTGRSGEPTPAPTPEPSTDSVAPSSVPQR